jgi:hypothetical protein
MGARAGELDVIQIAEANGKRRGREEVGLPERKEGERNVWTGMDRIVPDVA